MLPVVACFAGAAAFALVRPGAQPSRTPSDARPAADSSQAGVDTARVAGTVDAAPAARAALSDDDVAGDPSDDNDNSDDNPDDTPTTQPPSGPDRADILAGLAPVEPRLARCPVATPLAGTVHLTVAASGRVASATLSGALADDQAVAECVTRAVRYATFRHLVRPISLSWPLALRPPAPSTEGEPAAQPSGNSKR